MKHLLLTLLALVTAFSLVCGSTVQAESFDPFGQVCNSQNTQNATVCTEQEKPEDADGQNSIYGPNGVIAKVTTIISIVVGVASVIVLIIGGIKFIMSGGDGGGGKRAGDSPAGVVSARNTILYALIGLTIAAAAQGIVVFVINNL